MSRMADMRKDDGYRGLVMNPDTGQVLYAGAGTACDPFYIRVDSADQAPKITASKPAELVEKIVPNHREEKKEPVIEATPEAEASVDEDSGELALISLESEANATKDKTALKVIGNTLGLKLTNNMNISTMRDRISQQAESIRSANEGE